MAGWAPGRCPLGPTAEATIYVSSLTILLHRFSLSRWYHVASLRLQAFSFFFFFCSLFLHERQWRWSCASSRRWEPVRWKTVENKGGCGPPISSPKIEVRGEKMAHSSVSRPLEQSAAADPSETLAVGWRDADQWELRRSCVCGCECGCGCAANSAPPRLRSCSHGWSQRWFQCVQAPRMRAMQMVQTPELVKLPSKPSHFSFVSGRVSVYNFMLHLWIL